MMDHEAWKEKLSVLNEVSLTEQRSRAIWTNVENVINEAQTAKSSKRIHLYRRLMVGVSGMVAVLLVGILLTHEHFFAPSAEKTSAVKKHAQPSTQTASQFVTQYVNDLKHGDIAAAEACIAPEIRNRIWLLPTTKHEQWRVKPSSSGELRKKKQGICDCGFEPIGFRE